MVFFVVAKLNTHLKVLNVNPDPLVFPSSDVPVTVMSMVIMCMGIIRRGDGQTSIVFFQINDATDVSLMTDR